MKKNFKVNMILSILFISIIYSLSISVKTAKADCVDVTQDPCFCGLFDVPIGQDTATTSWFALYLNRSKGDLDYLRTLNLMVDTCNLLGDYKEVLACTDTNQQSGFTTMDACVYVQYLYHNGPIPFGFTRVVNIGDTLEIIDFDGRNTEFLYEISSLNTKFCDSKIILKYYDSLKPRIILELKLENHVKTGDLHQFFWEMNVGSFSIPTMFSIAVSSVINHNEGDSFLIRQQNDELHISTDFTFESTEIEIYNVLGICQIRSEMNSSAKVLDISQLPRGVYIVRIGSFISKFIRE
jgi:hypothetical protein